MDLCDDEWLANSENFLPWEDSLGNDSAGPESLLEETKTASVALDNRRPISDVPTGLPADAPQAKKARMDFEAFMTLETTDDLPQIEVTYLTDELPKLVKKGGLCLANQARRQRVEVRVRDLTPQQVAQFDEAKNNEIT